MSYRLAKELRRTVTMSPLLAGRYIPFEEGLAVAGSSVVNEGIVASAAGCVTRAGFAATGVVGTSDDDG